MADEGAISEAEFDDWLTPREALNALDKIGGTGTAVAAINLRVRGGHLLLGAEHIEIKRGASETTLPFSILLGTLWPSPHWMDDFWDTGQTAYEVRSGGQSMTRHVRIFGARFDPVGFERLKRAAGLIQRPKAAFEPGGDAKPTIGPGELKRWHDLFVKLHPNAPEALAVRSAAAMFPDNHVPRQYVRDLRGPQPIGKPKGRHKDRREGGD